jgi:hypothetical protein
MPSVSVSVTRPNDTTAYGAVDVIGAATGSTAALQFNGLGPADGAPLYIRGLSLRIDATALIASEAGYRVHMYSATPPSALGDNAAWDLPAGDRSVYLGFLDTGTIVDIGSTLWVESNNLAKPIQLTSGSLFCYLCTVAGHTPTANRVYTLSLHTETRF